MVNIERDDDLAQLLKIGGQVNFKLTSEKKMPFDGFMVIVKQKIIHRR